MPSARWRPWIPADPYTSPAHLQQQHIRSEVYFFVIVATVCENAFEIGYDLFILLGKMPLR
jgi:hypothetical protein